ncbi:hypothetical protein [Enterococcus sp. LJL51]|uniref:hypothetical protein n=1 Tax=Enterococcus sp. LJL51 TaxID=3416656 RepID=UPI003CF27C61
MKKLIPMFLLGCLLAAGCGKKEDPAAATLSSEDQAIVWAEKREKWFGKFDYLEIDQTEAKELMTDKFKVKIPALYEGAEAVFDEQLKSGETTKEKPICEVVSTGNSLRFTTAYPYKWADGKYYAYGKVELTYEWNADRQKAQLKYQEVELSHYSEDNKLYMADPLKAVEGFAKLAKVKDIDDKLATFTPEYEKAAEETLFFEQTIEQAMSDGLVGRNISVDFGETGTVSSILLFINDNRNI